MIAPLVDELRLADNSLQRAIFATAPRFRPLAPPVAVWATFRGRFADVAAAAGLRAVGRRWAWRCVQPRLARGPARRALTRWCVARGGEALSS